MVGIVWERFSTETDPSNENLRYNSNGLNTHYITVEHEQ